MFEKFTEGAVSIIMNSQEEARRMDKNYIGTEHLLLGIVSHEQGIGSRVLRSMQINLRKIRKELNLFNEGNKTFAPTDLPFTPRVKKIFELAYKEGIRLGQNYVGSEHLLLSLLDEHECIGTRTLKNLRVNISELKDKIFELIEETQENFVRPLTQTEKLIQDRERIGSITPTLDEYADNISKNAAEGKLDPVIGRSKEIKEVIKVLARRGKNNPVLIGQPGVGKTAVAEGLAQLLLTEESPDFLEGHIIMSLDIGSVLAGTKYRGEFEDRLKKIVDEIQNDSSIILVIDEIHTIVGAGAAEGSVDAANILKPAFARGNFKCIGATTIDEYRKYIERDPALERRFHPIYVKEPSLENTINILKGLSSKFEQHHCLNYDNKAIEQAAILAKKFITDRFLPDKAIDVLDEAGSLVRLSNRRLPKGMKYLLKELQETLREKEESIKDHDFEFTKQLVDHEMEVRSHITIMKQAALQNESLGLTRKDFDTVLEEDIAEVISNWTGVPVSKISKTESKQLLDMETILHKKLIGQDHAVIVVSRAIRRARVGFRNPTRPIANFIFAGPTGVGKTELTKALCEYMFETRDHMIRLDMSEYMEKHTVAKLIGSPPGYIGYSEGGQLTEAVRKKPYSVILFDEVEKAHPDIFNLLLQILDDGRLSDSKGRVINFNNTLIIMTTNLGSHIIERESGVKSQLNKPFAPIHINTDWKPIAEPIKNKEIFKKVTNLVHEELKEFFRPEFLNRIDEIVVFNHLTKIDIWEICGLMIDELTKMLKEKLLHLEVEIPVRSLLTEEGYDPIYGARPLRRVITRYLEDPLSEYCLKNDLSNNSKLVVKRVKNNSLHYINKIYIETGFYSMDTHLPIEEKIID